MMPTHSRSWVSPLTSDNISRMRETPLDGSRSSLRTDRRFRPVRSSCAARQGTPEKDEAQRPPACGDGTVV